MRDAYIITMPTIIKARTAEDGRRLVELEVSNEEKDAENDVILQSALLGSSASFLRTGHFDIDHISEIGDRLGVPNPASYIVGRPTKVIDLGDGRTGCECEIFRSGDGVHNAKLHKYDELWDSLNTNPPVRWMASIYGYPIDGMVDDCREQVCDKGAMRFLVKGIDWRSVAFTRNPVNTAISGYAKIVSAKSYIEDYKKNGASSYMPVATMDLSEPPNLEQAPMPTDHADLPVVAESMMNAPISMDELVGQYHRHIQTCEHTGGIDCFPAYREHFVKCCGCSSAQGEVLAAALMYHHLNSLL